MRPYLVLIALVLLAVAAFGQQPVPRSGPCLYGCGPYIPLFTTPQISLQTASPNPVGASNATTGLIAGATNSTLSQIEGSTSSESTVAVWYAGGGAPFTTREVRLLPEKIGREGRPVPEAIHSEFPREARTSQARLHETRTLEEQGPRHSEEARGDWTYITGPAAAASDFRNAGHVYTNDDVTRQNDKNGAVKYDGKTEKM